MLEVARMDAVSSAVEEPDIEPQMLANTSFD
jgi:hypothetical protein